MTAVTPFTPRPWTYNEADPSLPSFERSAVEPEAQGDWFDYGFGPRWMPTAPSKTPMNTTSSGFLTATPRALQNMKKTRPTNPLHGHPKYTYCMDGPGLRSTSPRKDTGNFDLPPPTLPSTPWRHDESDQRNWTLVIKDLGVEGNFKQALDVLQQMRRANMEPSELTYNFAMCACHRAKQYEAALSLLAEMSEHGVVASVSTMALAMDVCAQCEAWEAALAISIDIQQANVPLDAVAYNAALAACELGGQWQEGVEMLADMRAQGHSPSAPAQGAVIRCCAENGEWRQAIKLLDEMRADGIAPHMSLILSAYGAAIEALEPTDEWFEALRILELLPPKERPLELLVRAKKLQEKHQRYLEENEAVRLAAEAEAERIRLEEERLAAEEAAIAAALKAEDDAKAEVARAKAEAKLASVKQTQQGGKAEADDDASEEHDPNRRSDDLDFGDDGLSVAPTPRMQRCAVVDVAEAEALLTKKGKPRKYF
eukprot:TRINITY_DN24508_c0_g1_i1.p1 TRINITY_DN24508_c0_g1~~TRINITY_DN24508_c0_g1_i1.p1  ORF type:complete len:484 (+),score=140.14 TRINITY_DN24508_c0_g1_i1:81-1532(+)